jgi:hypothetical protein
MDKDKRDVRLESCTDRTLWVIAILNVSGTAFKESLNISDDERTEWLKLPIQ